MQRRSFFKRISEFLTGFSVLAGLGWFSKLMENHLAAHRRVLLLRPDQIRGEYFEQSELWLLKSDQGIKVLSRRCPHLGCTLQKKTRGTEIFCPCHGSRFNLQGQYLKGPAKKDLDVLDYTILEDGSIQIQLNG